MIYTQLLAWGFAEGKKSEIERSDHKKNSLVIGEALKDDPALKKGGLILLIYVFRSGLRRF